MIGRKPQVVYFMGKPAEHFWGCAGHLLNLIPDEGGGILLGAKIETVPRIHRAIAMMFGQRVAAWLLQNQKVTFGLGGQYIPRNCFKPPLETIMFNHKVGKAGTILIMTDLYGNPNRESEMWNIEAKMDDLRMEAELLSEQLDKSKRLLAKVLISAREEEKAAVAAPMENLKELADIYSMVKSKDTETERAKLERRVKSLEKKEGEGETSEEGEGAIDKLRGLVKRE